MKLLKYLLSILTLGFMITSLHAQVGQDTPFGRDLNTRDDQSLREFVQSKENIDVKDKSKNLEISGDVRFEWRSIQEKGEILFFDPSSDSYASSLSEHFHTLRGGKHIDANGLPISTNDFDVEFNLKIKYTFKDAWAKAHIQFDNPAGIRGRNACHGTFPIFNKKGDKVTKKIPRDSRWAIKGSGEANFITLKRAFMGYNIYADGRHRLDIEIGRQKLDDIFNSEIAFTSRFDGVLLRFASNVEEVFDWYTTVGAFVIDERANHFGFVGEIGFLDICDTGLDVRYNIIDWKKHGRNRCFILNPLGSEFVNSQISLTYTFTQSVGCQEFPVELYGGFLINHAAKKTKFTHRKKKNLGWYAGAYIGNVDKKGDWSLDIEYIGVQAQAVPEHDVGSVGRGNILDESLLDILTTSSDLSKSSSREIGFYPRRGNTNFTGWKFEFLYAITDNFSVDMVYEFSNEEDKRIGGRHHYRDFEIEAVYAF